MTGQRLTRKEAAEHFGVSATRVGELIRDGRLAEAGATVDLEEAEALWASMDPDYRSRMVSQKAAKVVSDKINETFNRAKTAKMVAQAQEADLELKIKQGLFVPKQMVTQQAYTAAKQFHTRLTMLPRQLAPQLAIESSPAEIEQMLTSAIDVIVAEIRNALAELGTPAG